MNRLATRELSMLIALAAIWAFFAWQEPVFLSARNLSLLSVELAVTAVLALGMLVVLLPGQIDLSAGSGVGLAGAVAAVLVFWHGVPAPAGPAARDRRRRAGVVGHGRADRDRAHSRVHHDAGRPAGVPRPALAGDRQPDRAGRRGRRPEPLLAADHVLPAAAGRLRARRQSPSARSRRRRCSARRRRQSYGFAVDDGELTFLKLFVLAQLVLLAVIVTNGYRGVPVALVILGVVAVLVHQLRHATRRSAAISTRSAATRRRRRSPACRCAHRHRRLRADGRHRRADRASCRPPTPAPPPRRSAR